MTQTQAFLWLGLAKERKKQEHLLRMFEIKSAIYSETVESLV